EFSIYGGANYIKATVQLDQSSLETPKLSRNITPDYIEDTVFLLLLASGDANLYYHHGKTLKNFFYSKNSGPIEPLVYKKYISQPLNFGTQSIKENKYFQQQLEKGLTCDGFTALARNLSYRVTDLVNYFNEYNSCTGSITSFAEPKSTTSFHLRIRPGINKSGMELNSASGHA